MDNTKIVKTQTATHRTTKAKPTDSNSTAKPVVENVKLSVAIENALNNYNHTFRLREIDEAVEHNGIMMRNLAYNDILLDAADCGFKVEKRVNEVMYRMASRNIFHPILEYLQGLKWDGQDHIAKLASYFVDTHAPIKYADGTSKTVFHAFLTKYLVGAIGKVHNCRRTNVDDYWQNAVLVLAGAQGIGKGNFVAWLARDVKNYFSEDMFNPDEKELDWKLSSVWISEMSEAMKTLNKSDSDSLKFKLTQKTSKFRKPYDRHWTETTQIVNPIATLNPNGVGFFKDKTGNRRFNTVTLSKIDWNYSIDVKPSDIWAQAFSMYQHGHTNQLSLEERAVQLSITADNTEANLLEDFLQDGFTMEKDNKAFHMSTKAIIDYLVKSGYKAMSLRALQMEISELLTSKGFMKGKYAGLNGWYGLVLKGDTNPSFVETGDKLAEINASTK